MYLVQYFVSINNCQFEILLLIEFMIDDFLEYVEVEELKVGLS